MTQRKLHIDKFVSALRGCKTIEDFVSLLNRVEKETDEQFVSKVNRKMITVKSLQYLLYVNKDVYRTFEISKKSGGTRTITQPSNHLKRVQRIINTLLTSCYQPMPTATGFIKGRSIVSNAKRHVNKKYVYNIDIKDFFPSVGFPRIWGLLSRSKHFNLDNEIARIIATLCTHNKCLPQGAPTSPYLANAVCIVLDAKLYYMSKEMGFSYSRYADDITISSNKNIFSPEFKLEISSIIKEEGFNLNLAKERLQRNNVRDRDGKIIRERQEVTGIIVNRKTNVSRSYINNLRAAIYSWETSGYKIASDLHNYYYKREKGFIRYKGQIPPIEAVLRGKIEYLGMVRGKEDKLYATMTQKLNKLIIAHKEPDKSYIENTLYRWITMTKKKASSYFYNIRQLGNVKWNKYVRKG